MQSDEEAKKQMAKLFGVTTEQLDRCSGPFALGYMPSEEEVADVRRACETLSRELVEVLDRCIVPRKV